VQIDPVVDNLRPCGRLRDWRRITHERLVYHHLFVHVLTQIGAFVLQRARQDVVRELRGFVHVRLDTDEELERLQGPHRFQLIGHDVDDIGTVHDARANLTGTGLQYLVGKYAGHHFAEQHAVTADATLVTLLPPPRGRQYLSDRCARIDHAGVGDLVASARITPTH